MNDFLGFVCVLTLFLTACGEQPAPDTLVDDAPILADLLAGSGVEEIDEYLGLSIEEMIDEAGEPTTRDTLSLADGLPGEFYVELYNFHHPNDPATDTTHVIEYTWDRRGFTDAVFFHVDGTEWVSFDTVRWLDGVEF